MKSHNGVQTHVISPRRLSSMCLRLPSDELKDLTLHRSGCEYSKKEDSNKFKFLPEILTGGILISFT